MFTNDLGSSLMFALAFLGALCGLLALLARLERTPDDRAHHPVAQVPPAVEPQESGRPPISLE
jgi:hypothetical protein